MALHPYEPVGCFKDATVRALPELVQSYSLNKTDLANSVAAIIHACATRVYENGFWYFGLENRQECWSGVSGDITHDRHGRSNSCLWDHGVGDKWAIFVYRFVEG